MGIEQIISRRSVRHFDGKPLQPGELDALLEAARWAPSGLNNQPWRFVTVEGAETLETLAGFTKYGKMVRTASAAVAVFLDTTLIYNRTKDVQSIGAACQNILLAAHFSGIGACWLGEILNRSGEVEKALAVPDTLELMAVILLGRQTPGAHEGKREREELSRLIVGRF